MRHHPHNLRIPQVRTVETALQATGAIQLQCEKAGCFSGFFSAVEVEVPGYAFLRRGPLAGDMALVVLTVHSDGRLTGVLPRIVTLPEARYLELWGQRGGDLADKIAAMAASTA